MEDARFDRFVRAVAGLTSRRRLLGAAASAPMVGGALALLDPGETEAKRRKKKNKKRKKGKPATCTPDAQTTTCAGKCGVVIDNCDQAVDCGSCACDPPCGECLDCNEATGKCVPEAAGTPCGTSASCANSFEHRQDTCDGNGMCQPGEDRPCQPYRCAGNACATTCGADFDCEPVAYCNTTTGECTQKIDNGQSCQANSECFSGACCGNVCRQCCGNDDCAAFGPGTPFCLGNICVGCGESPGECPNGTCCNQFSGECVAHCPEIQVCATTNICTPPCFNHANCNADELCVEGVCRACDVVPNVSTLQAAIDAAEPRSTLYVCPGFYATVSGETLITKSLIIVGAGDGPGETRLQGQVNIDGRADPEMQVVLRDVRVTAIARGIFLQEAELAMERCTVRGSTASQGIGVVNAGGFLEMQRCNIIDITTSATGGGIQNTNGTVILRNCRIEGNTAAQGAGISTGSTSPEQPSALELHNTEVRGNTANSLIDAIGAGIYSFGDASTVTISNDSNICENVPNPTQCEGISDVSRCSANCPD